MGICLSQCKNVLQVLVEPWFGKKETLAVNEIRLVCLAGTACFEQGPKFALDIETESQNRRYPIRLCVADRHGKGQDGTLQKMSLSSLAMMNANIIRDEQRFSGKDLLPLRLMDFGPGFGGKFLGERRGETGTPGPDEKEAPPRHLRQFLRKMRLRLFLQGSIPGLAVPPGVGNHGGDQLG